ncbi:hypothetical protein DNH61_13045 [Paenibacillus sambharensis]|uniref:Uncharacterized protein n=1 Tax=Paenibacillus sambharensis TaxID=1803190 RepID=A0A2W1LKN5_9BACL|nr:hypothetical protein [Paenibacillus sambharensis]PZD95455.1 hypothetical protein DNH61_13045 [Paenibacillus sambharensis]
MEYTKMLDAVSVTRQTTEALIDTIREAELRSRPGFARIEKLIQAAHRDTNPSERMQEAASALAVLYLFQQFLGRAGDELKEIHASLKHASETAQTAVSLYDWEAYPKSQLSILFLKLRELLEEAEHQILELQSLSSSISQFEHLLESTADLLQEEIVAAELQTESADPEIVRSDDEFMTCIHERQPIAVWKDEERIAGYVLVDAVTSDTVYMEGIAYSRAEHTFSLCQTDPIH